MFLAHQSHCLCYVNDYLFCYAAIHLSIFISIHKSSYHLQASGKATLRASTTHAYNSAIIFVDAHVLVSPHWLLPISSSLTRYPKALVYPVLDVLVPASPGSDKDYEGKRRMMRS